MMRALVLTVGALWLSACNEGMAPQAPVREEPVLPTPPPPRVPVEASTRLAPAPDGVRSVARLRAVELELTVRGVSGEGQLDVEFLAPGQLPYEKRTLRVQALPTESRTLSFSLPVAGTSIASSGMSGAWEARFFLDGEPLASSTFTLEP